MDIGNAQRRALGITGDSMWMQLGMTEAQFLTAQKQHARDRADRSAGERAYKLDRYEVSAPIGRMRTMLPILSTSDKATAVEFYESGKHLGYEKNWPDDPKPRQLSKGQLRKLRKRH
jgi:hypothetical protein